MQFFFKKYKIFLRVLFGVSTIILALFYGALKPKKVLPIYQPSMVNYELVDSTLQHVKKYHKIAPFSFENQNGKTITQDDYEGKIYIADFFFTTCPTICPKMTANMGSIQEEILNDSTVMLLSFSVTPKIDSVPQLKKYAIEKGVNDEKWNLLTGNKKEIYTMARKSYLVVKEDGDGGPYDMIHTENFILVDPKKRIRGFYDGTDTLAMRELLIDLEILKDEFFPHNFFGISIFQ
jgi:protein SCO1/2